MHLARFVKPFPQRQILDFSKLKQSANENFKFDEIGKKLSKPVENTVGKGGIVRDECFQKTFTADT